MRQYISTMRQHASTTLNNLGINTTRRKIAAGAVAATVSLGGILGTYHLLKGSDVDPSDTSRPPIVAVATTPTPHVAVVPVVTGTGASADTEPTEPTDPEPVAPSVTSDSTPTASSAQQTYAKLMRGGVTLDSVVENYFDNIGITKLDSGQDGVTYKLPVLTESFEDTILPNVTAVTAERVGGPFEQYLVNFEMADGVTTRTVTLALDRDSRQTVLNDSATTDPIEGVYINDSKLLERIKFYDQLEANPFYFDRPDVANSVFEWKGKRDATLRSRGSQKPIDLNAQDSLYLSPNAKVAVVVRGAGSKVNAKACIGDRTEAYFAGEADTDRFTKARAIYKPAQQPDAPDTFYRERVVQDLGAPSVFVREAPTDIMGISAGSLKDNHGDMFNLEHLVEGSPLAAKLKAKGVDLDWNGREDTYTLTLPASSGGNNIALTGIDKIEEAKDTVNGWHISYKKKNGDEGFVAYAHARSADEEPVIIFNGAHQTAYTPLPADHPF